MIEKKKKIIGLVVLAVILLGAVLRSTILSCDVDTVSVRHCKFDESSQQNVVSEYSLSNDDAKCIEKIINSAHLVKHLNALKLHFSEYLDVTLNAHQRLLINIGEIDYKGHQYYMEVHKNIGDAKGCYLPEDVYNSLISILMR